MENTEKTEIDILKNGICLEPPPPRKTDGLSDG